jgi:hypothetical protein
MKSFTFSLQENMKSVKNENEKNVRPFVTCFRLFSYFRKSSSDYFEIRSRTFRGMNNKLLLIFSIGNRTAFSPECMSDLEDVSAFQDNK